MRVVVEGNTHRGSAEVAVVGEVSRRAVGKDEVSRRVVSRSKLQPVKVHLEAHPHHRGRCDQGGREDLQAEGVHRWGHGRDETRHRATEVVELYGLDSARHADGGRRTAHHARASWEAHREPADGHPRVLLLELEVEAELVEEGEEQQVVVVQEPVQEEGREAGAAAFLAPAAEAAEAEAVGEAAEAEAKGQ